MQKVDHEVVRFLYSPNEGSYGIASGFDLNGLIDMYMSCRVNLPLEEDIYKVLKTLQKGKSYIMSSGHKISPL